MATENKKDVFDRQYIEIKINTNLDLTGADMIALLKDANGNETTHTLEVTDVTAGTCLLTIAKGELISGRLEIQPYDKVTGIPGKIGIVYINTRLNPVIP